MHQPLTVLCCVVVLCCTAFGGPGIQTCLFHLSNLFPDWKSSITSIINGSFQISFLVFFFLDQLWYFDGWTYQELFFICACIGVVNICISLVMWPDKPYNYEEQIKTAVSVLDLQDVDGGASAGNASMQEVRDIYLHGGVLHCLAI
jgi:hypothetical protein